MTTIQKIWDILTSSQRVAAAWLAVMMTVGMLLEMLGVGIVLPALATLSGGQMGGETSAISRVRAWLGNPDEARLIVVGLCALLAVYMIKAVFLVCLAWRQAKFVANLQSSMSRRLLTLYLHQAWTFHLQRNSATLIQKISGDVSQFAIMLTALLCFMTELLVVVGVGCLLLVVEPVGAIAAAATLGVATWIFQRLTRRRIDNWGARCHDFSQRRSKHLIQGLAGAKDAKILGREASLVASYHDVDMVVTSMQSRLATAQQLPRLWYELLAVAGLAVLGATLIWQGHAGAQLLPRMGLFAAAAFRLMPSANRMMLTWQSLRFAKPVIESLHAEFSLAAPELKPAGPAHDFQREIRLSDVSFQYPGAAGKALDGVQLRLKQGHALGVIGGSGAGKSTLVDVILGLLTPDYGTVLVDDRDVHENVRSWQDQIGYVPQSIYLTDDTIAANVAFGVPPEEIDIEAVRRALKAAQLDDFVGTLPEGLDTFVGERGVRLSGGQRQRIGIARALYRDPPILILDEATSSLDTETEKGVMAAVNEMQGSKTLIIVAHRLSTVADCDELIRLERGRIVNGGAFAEVIATPGQST